MVKFLQCKGGDKKQQPPVLWFAENAHVCDSRNHNTTNNNAQLHEGWVGVTLTASFLPTPILLALPSFFFAPSLSPSLSLSLTHTCFQFFHVFIHTHTPASSSFMFFYTFWLVHSSSFSLNTETKAKLTTKQPNYMNKTKIVAIPHEGKPFKWKLHDTTPDLLKLTAATRARIEY